MPFPVRESETCFGNPLKCLKKRFSPMLFSPCYLSEVFLVGYSVELETANLHRRWRSLPFIVPPSLSFLSSSYMALLPLRVCPLRSCWPSSEFSPSSSWVTKGKSVLCSLGSVRTANCHQKFVISPTLWIPEYYCALIFVFSHLAKRTVEKWMQQSPQPHLGLALCFHFLSPAINQVSLLWQAVWKEGH